MTQNNVVNIHGKPYITVAGRVQQAHEALKEGLAIETFMVAHSEEGVLFKAKVTVPKGTFTGFSFASYKAQGIEGQSPFEVAETSAVGRALGFAGFGSSEGIATADEIIKAEATPKSNGKAFDYRCVKCNKPITAPVYEYSTQHLGEALCMDCQKKSKDEMEEKVDTESTSEEDDLSF
jgi:hypothetical protein